MALGSELTEQEVKMESSQGKTPADGGPMDKPTIESRRKQDWQEPILERFPLNDALTGPNYPKGDFYSSS